MALRDRYQSMDQNARAAVAQQYIGAAAAAMRPGLGGSGSVGPDPAPPILLYPSDIGFNPQEASYILFTGYSISNAKVKPIKEPPKIKTGQRFDDNGVPIAVDKEAEAIAYKKSWETLNADRNTGTSFVLSTRNIPKSGTVIGLYMPPSVNVSYSMDYENAPIGVMGEAIAGIIRDIQGGTGASDAMSKAAGTMGTGLKQMGIKMIDAVIPGAKDLIAIETGTIVTPRTELMFRGIGRRQFSFTFTFIPKDRKESRIVHKIVKKFKEGMSPSFKQASTTRELTIPDVFQIDYMHITKQNSYLNKIGKCYLEKMDVTYGGDKFVTYDYDAGPEPSGPPPQKTTITLSFRELEIMDRAKVSAGF